MKTQSFTDKAKKWINWSEKPMLVLAFIAVIIYMASLMNVWKILDLEKPYFIVSLLIDIVFVLDLLLKIIVLKKPYLKSPWIVIDTLAALPILASMGLPESFAGLRVIRGIRLFRALRTLRLLRIIPIVQFDSPNQPVTKEMISFQRAMWIIVPLYAVLFVILIHFVYAYYGEEGRIIEFYLLLGSLLGLLLVIALVRYLMPAYMAAQVYSVLNVAMPSQAANYFAQHPESYNRTVSMPATILFCDIKGFTNAVEKLGGDLTALKEHLEAVLNVVTDIHSKYDLIIDKFIGDAILSFRGGTLVTGNAEEHAWRVVRAAIEGYKAMKKLSDPYFLDMKVGGASSNAVLIGAFGTSTRISYTILGDRVNLAARLESAVKQCGTTNLFCPLTYELLKDKKDLIWRRFGKIRVEGKNEALDIYEVFDAEDISDKQWITFYHSALADFEARRFKEAREKFKIVNTMHPNGDKPSTYYVNLCSKLIFSPPGADWNPIFITSK